MILHEFSDFLQISNAIYQDSFQPGLMVKKKISENKVISLNMFNVEIWLKLCPLLVFLFAFILLLKLVLIKSLVKKIKLILNSLFSIDFKLTESMNAVSFVILFYLIYLMIFKSILSNSIKTNSVIVNVSKLVDTGEDLLNSKR